MSRHICGKEGCGLQFRYEADFEEHGRVGCVVPQGTGETFSARDGDMDAPPRPAGEGQQEEGGE